jgi:hypothetical protein
VAGQLRKRQAWPLHDVADGEAGGAHVEPWRGSHHATTVVANNDCCNRPTIAAVTARASGAVRDSGDDPADAASRAAASTAETSALFWIAQSPESTAARKQSRKSGATNANSTVA